MIDSSRIPMSKKKPVKEPRMLVPIDYLSRLLKIPQKLIHRLVKEGLIHDPIRDDELKALEILARIYGSDWYIRVLVSRINQKRRTKILRTASFSKGERFALSLYQNAEPGRRLPIDYIITTVKNFTNDSLTKGQVIKVRRHFYYQKRQFQKISSRRSAD